MRPSLKSVLTLLMVAALVPALYAQQRRGTPDPAAGAPAPAPATSPQSPANASGTIDEREIFVNRSALDAAVKQTTGANSSNTGKSGFSVNRLVKALGVDDNRQHAAEELIEMQAGTEAARRSRMAIVVVGSADDRKKVRDSLSSLQKPVILMYVNPDFTDDNSDNSPLKGGLTGQFTNQATNIWVFTPGASPAADPEPSQRLSTRVITPQVWSGLLVAGGDSTEVGALATSFRPKSGDVSASSSGTATPAASATPGRFAEGDVLTPKIANVRVQSDPKDDAKAVATLTKSDELVVIGGEQNGFVKVQGSTATGWVKATLVEKR